MKFENDRLIELDCGDNSCRYAPKENKGGMRTNGGCRCHEKFAQKIVETTENKRWAYDNSVNFHEIEKLISDFARICKNKGYEDAIKQHQDAIFKCDY